MEIIAVVSVQPPFRPNPHPSRSILKKTSNPGAGNLTGYNSGRFRQSFMACAGSHEDREKYKN